jgi:hypothetical protein
VDVPASEFDDLKWLGIHVGPTATAYPKMKEVVAVAVKRLSAEVHGGAVPRTTIYRHLGWRTLPSGEPVFLTAAGALGASGLVSGVEVALDGPFTRFQLFGVERDGALRTAVRASLSLLDIGPDSATVPALAVTYRAPLGEQREPWRWWDTPARSRPASLLSAKSILELSWMPPTSRRHGATPTTPWR